jgi:Putative DNA-binding domain
MSPPAIRYDPESQDLVIDGYGQLLTEGAGVFLAPIAIVEDLTLTEVGSALRRWAEDNGGDDPRLEVSPDSPEHFGDHSTGRASYLGLQAGQLVMRAHAFTGTEPVDRGALTAPLRAFLQRQHAEITHLDVAAMPGFWMLTVSIEWRRPGASVLQALELAGHASALLEAGTGGEITASVASDLVRAGHTELLIGMRENEWLEVKGSPYRLDEPTQEIELAKDVAAMANASGGMILLGVKAKKLPEYEEIRTINGCQLADVSPRRYRNVIRRRVFPEVRGFTVESVPGAKADEGVVLLSIPRQAVGEKPFVVHGAVVGEKVLGAFVGIPYRRGDETFFIDPQTLHARLRAGEHALAAREDSVLAELQAQLRETRDATVLAWLRTVVAAARHDGIAVEHGRGSVSFSGPGQATVVVSSEEQGPLVDEFQRQRLVEQLAALGLRTRRGTRGQLVPVFGT